jgi:hypothetical protein
MTSALRGWPRSAWGASSSVALLARGYGSLRDLQTQSTLAAKSRVGGRVTCVVRARVEHWLW